MNNAANAKTDNLKFLIYIFNFIFILLNSQVAPIITNAKHRQLMIPMKPCVNQSGNTIPVKLARAYTIYGRQ
jgi:hypothetical protein